MKILVVGAGQQGSACLWYLARQPAVSHLGLADREAERVESVAGAPWAPGIATHVADVSDGRVMSRLFEDYDAVVSAVPYVFNENLTGAAVAGKAHFVDMGGNTDIVMAQRRLDADARAAGVVVLPDAGLAPGLGCVLGGHLIREEAPVEVRIRVGGLPQHPEPPLDYALVFSPYGLLNEYAEEAIVLRGGRVERLPVLEGEETLEFSGVGRLEAAFTSGGASTMPFTFEGRVDELDYKTIRFPGHFAKIRVLRDLGFIEDRTVFVPPLSGGEPFEVSLRDVVASLLAEKLPTGEVRDQVLVRVTARSKRRARTLEIHDLYDAESGISAMRRCTAFPVAIEAMLACEGAVPRTGVLAQETDVDARRVIAGLAECGIEVRDRVEEG